MIGSYRLSVIHHTIMPQEIDRNGTAVLKMTRRLPGSGLLYANVFVELWGPPSASVSSCVECRKVRDINVSFLILFFLPPSICRNSSRHGRSIELTERQKTVQERSPSAVVDLPCCKTPFRKQGLLLRRNWFPPPLLGFQEGFYGGMTFQRMRQRTERPESIVSAS